MPTAKFSDLSLLWPFANELGRTLFVYKERKKDTRPHIPPNDGMAKFVLATALGSITMDDSTPSYYLVGKRDREYRDDKNSRHLIYVGGGIENEAVRELFDACQKNIRRVVNLPSSEKRPRKMKIKSENVRIDLTTSYYDRAKNYVNTDYGLVLLITNPFANEDSWKVLLVAGNHSYGTLAAARAISSPSFSEEISRPILANFHLPPHLLGTVEIVVKAEVDRENARLHKENILYLFINGQLIPVNLYKGNQLKPKVKFATLTTHITRSTNDLKISFNRNRTFGSEKATLAIKSETSLLSDEFFNFFSNHVVIVISPHSDDSAIGCGGLIYYLRNKRIWQAKGKECPPVEVLVMKESVSEAVTVDYLETYCADIGLRKSFSKKLINDKKAVIRHNESKAEEMLLGTNSKWLQLDKLEGSHKSRREEDKIADSLKEIINKYKGRIPLVLIPQLTDQHTTHKNFAVLLMTILREWRSRLQGNCHNKPPKLSKMEVWTYESPWSTFDPLNIYDINVVILLDKHAMFAKCQAISMHQSQEIRTRFSDVARTHSKRIAEILPEMLLGYGKVRRKWDYIEVFSSRVWIFRDFSKAQRAKTIS